MQRLRRIFTIASSTVTQLLRMKILVFLLLFCVLVVGAAFAFPVMNESQQLKLLKDVSFGALQIFSIVLAIAATALLIPRDVEDRTLYTILAKPVPRLDYILGKYFGVIFLILCGLVLMDIAFSGVLYLRQEMVLQDAIANHIQANRGQADAATVAALSADIAQQGLTWTLHLAIWAIFMKAAVVTALSLLISCMSSSTLFTIITSFCFVVIGHGQSLFRDYFFQGGITRLDYLLSALLAVACPDLGLFDVVDAVLEGHQPSLQEMLTMTGLGTLYILGYLTVTHLIFVEKEL
jgi:hypothetical protein